MLKELRKFKTEFLAHLSGGKALISIEVNHLTYELLLREIESQLRHGLSSSYEEAYDDRVFTYSGIIIKERLCTCGAYDA